MPPSLEKWLPENHLARFVVETVETLDTTALEEVYDRRGSEAYHPKMLLALLFYGEEHLSEEVEEGKGRGGRRRGAPGRDVRS